MAAAKMYAFHGQGRGWADVCEDGSLAVRLLTSQTTFDDVIVRSEPDNEESRITMAMTSEMFPSAATTQPHMHTYARLGRLVLWNARIPLNQDKDQTHYVFKLFANGRQWWLDATGVLKPRMPGREYHFRYNRVDRPPAWVPSQIFYQIFPDRFCNGDPSISVRDGEYMYLGSPVVARKWGEPVTDTEEQRCSEFYGGDLIGVRQKLDYLHEELGVTALYLNPIFTSLSNHKYDTVDYMHVDPHFGGDKALADLSRELKKRDMRIILDAVLNHTSVHHIWFDKYGDARFHSQSEDDDVSSELGRGRGSSEGGEDTQDAFLATGTSSGVGEARARLGKGKRKQHGQRQRRHQGQQVLEGLEEANEHLEAEEEEQKEPLGEGRTAAEKEGKEEEEEEDEGKGKEEGDSGEEGEEEEEDVMQEIKAGDATSTSPMSGRRSGAYLNPESEFRDFYFFHPEAARLASAEENSERVMEEERYVAWCGYESLPKLNLAHRGVQEYLYAEEKAVIRHWLRPPYSADGWRFDVIHMLGEGANATNNAFYVRQFRQATKETNPEGYVLGEHFYEATQWLQGDQEDGCMAYYSFLHPMRAFFARKDIVEHPIEIDAQELSSWLCESRAKIPWANQLALFNQLDSHDTSRMLTLVDGNVELFKCAVTVLFTYPGTPCVYYGDEVGVEGGKDPDCRRCFPWDRKEWNMNLFQHFRRLAALRKSSPALCYGSYVPLYAHGNVFAFARWHQHEVVVCIVNRGSRRRQQQQQQQQQQEEEEEEGSVQSEEPSEDVYELPVWRCGVEEGVMTNVLSLHDDDDLVAEGLKSTDSKPEPSADTFGTKSLGKHVHVVNGILRVEHWMLQTQGQDCGSAVFHFQ